MKDAMQIEVIKMQSPCVSIIYFKQIKKLYLNKNMSQAGPEAELKSWKTGGASLLVCVFLTQCDNKPFFLFS